jgi:hypothetical protein
MGPTSPSPGDGMIGRVGVADVSWAGCNPIGRSLADALLIPIQRYAVTMVQAAPTRPNNAIEIEQRKGHHRPRSTSSTTVDIIDHGRAN